MTPIEELGTYADVPVDLQVVIDRLTLRIGDLLALRPGKTLATRRLLREQLDLQIGDLRLGSVEVKPCTDTVSAEIASLEVG